MPSATNTSARRHSLLQAVQRTIAALELLAASPDGVSVLRAADALRVDKGTASRLLASLLELGYVERDPATERYELSLRIISLASQQIDRIGFPAICQPVLDELAARTRELVQLSVVEREDLVIAAHAEAVHHRLTIRPSVGANVTPHATASGKAFLASLSNDQAIQIVERHGLVALTEQTITAVGDLLVELDRARAAGYALATGEFMEHINAIAFAIGPTRFGKVVGTVALSAPASRFGPEQIHPIAAEVGAAAAELEVVWPAHAVRLAAPVEASPQPPTA
jgi:DNA-binding IclR family transcriptional regulator